MTTATGNTLTDRYVAATLRTVPEKQRPDIEKELRASIADAIDDRLEAGAEARGRRTRGARRARRPHPARRQLRRPAALPDRAGSVPRLHPAAARCCSGSSCRSCSS